MDAEAEVYFVRRTLFQELNRKPATPEGMKYIVRMIAR